MIDTVRAADSQVHVPLGKNWMDDDLLVASTSWGTRWYSIILNVTMYEAANGIIRFWWTAHPKSQFIFFHVKILHLKKRSKPQREAEKQEKRLFYFITPLHRHPVFSEYRIFSKGNMKFPRRLTFETTNLSLFFLLLLLLASQSYSFRLKSSSK